MFKEYQMGGEAQQNPLEMLTQQSYGISFEELASMTPQERANFMGEKYGITDKSLLNPGQFGGSFNLENLQSKTYDPSIAGTQGSLVSELLAGQRGVSGGKGFAGSYAPQAQMEGLYDVYGKGMGSVLGGISQSKLKAQEKMTGMISGYGTTAAKLRG